MLGAGLGAMTLLSLTLRVGWIVPCMIAGVYLGMLLDPAVKGGTAESKMVGTVSWIVVGTIIGFVTGLFVDRAKASQDGNCQNEHGGKAESPLSDSEAAGGEKSPSVRK